MMHQADRNMLYTLGKGLEGKSPIHNELSKSHTTIA